MTHMKSVATASLDSAGRLTVPEPIRQQAGLVPGMELEIRFRDGRVEIEPARRAVRVVKRGKVYVAEPLEPSEPLTQEIVRETQKALRHRDIGD